MGLLVAAPALGLLPALLTPPACVPHHVPQIGLACDAGDGIFALYSDAGEFLGFSHGGDPPFAGPPPPLTAQAAATSGVVCSDGGTSEYYVQVIYARGHTDDDEYAAKLGQIRAVVHQANALIESAGTATGGVVRLRTKCVDGEIDVRNEVVVGSTQNTFNAIANALKARGYNTPRIKYWVYWDEAPSETQCLTGCIAGQGLLYQDSTLSVNNYNNGNPAAVPMFAMSFGFLDVRTMLHELGHTLGAVQNGAPRSTQAGHCIDGLDIMCYDDNGPRGSSYNDGICSVEVFDCGRNDYFNVNPSPVGSTVWLYSHWNVGSPLVRFTQHAGPVVQALDCAPGEVRNGEATTCSFAASASTATVSFLVHWADGTRTTTAAVAPGSTVTASHSWTGDAYRNVRVIAVDAAGKRSPAAGSSVAVECPLSRAGHIDAGLVVLDSPGISSADETGIPAACAGRTFDLRATGGIVDDFDVCWFAGSTEIGCDANGGDETGAIPEGADRARILFFSGEGFVLGGDYALTVRPP